MENDEEDEYDPRNSKISWSDLIFLPFHPVFKLLVLYSAVLKSIFGPIQAIYPIIYCSDTMDRNLSLSFIKYSYWYVSDVIYGIDTFLHIVHRQITDKSCQREYLPKSALLLQLDIISLVPFFQLFTSDLCPPVEVFPNILSFTEFIVIYRVMDYFSFLRTHSIWRMVMGFTVLTVITVNCITCFFLLLTENGLCSSCVTGVHDWRVSLHELNTTKSDEFSTYAYGASFVYIYIINIMMEDTIPHTIAGYLLVALFMMFGYGMATFVVFPKIVAECIYRVRSFVEFYPLVQRIISETRRRNPSPLAHVDVENFYTLMWKNRGGVTFTPHVLTQLPRYLRVDIRQDVVWSVFYHSPTLKKTSNSYKRWLCECIHLDYKLPGEKFFSGPHCRTNLYYLKSGIVQLISTDDSTTPLLSVTSGTVFGDISFFLPPLHKKETAVCLTYCEVFYVSRADILKSLYIFPEDRQIILQKTKERINHARTLYTCKQHIRGLDRTEDEGVAWVKRRWWEISDCVANWKKSNREDLIKCELPPEDAIYHCSKYIGQLVLCTDSQLQSKSLFSKVSFPWILAPNSKFTLIWNRIIFYTVFLVLIFYPVCITMENIPEMFKYFEHWTNIIYPMDIFLSFLTAIERQESMISNSYEIIFTRFKSFTFLMDVFATLWIEDLVLIIGKPQLYNICKFNRLIKIYVLFMGAYIRESSGFSINPLFCDLYKIILGYFSLFYISGCLSHALKDLLSDLTTTSYFVESYCKRFCLLDRDNVYLVVIAWTMLISFFQYPRKSFTDIYYAAVLSFFIFFVAIFSKSRLIAALFVNYRETTNFQCFVTNLKLFYKHKKIHPDLLRRLNRYMLCHWKYYKGMDVMHPNLLKDIPYDIYWKVHGEGAVKLIGSSKAFVGADPALIREIAYKSKFLMLPKHSTINLFGIQSVNVTWLAQGSIKCEYHNDKGELQKFLYPSGQMMSLSSVFLGKTALRTYSAYTDCEVLYLPRKDFFNTIKRFPNEMSYFDCCTKEISQDFEKVYKKYVKKHRLYQQKLQDRVFHARISTSTDLRAYSENEKSTDESDQYHIHFWTDPESRFIKWWLIIRTVFVVISIICASLQENSTTDVFSGGSGAIYRPWLKIACAGCDCVSIIDIILKCFLCYYDERGLLISDIRKCMFHYITRGFAMDLVGALPWYDFINEVHPSSLEEETLLILNTMCKFAHLYLLLGYFNYIADKPSINMGYMMILKWQIFILLIMFGASQYFVSECINFTWDEFSNVIDMERKNSCWLPNHMPINDNPSEGQLHLVFAHSLSFSQSGIVNVNLGKYNLDFHNVIIIIIIFILEIAFWFVMCYSVTLVMLATRGSRLYQHGVGKVKQFLESERAEKEIIERAVAHFGYWWQRTKGINIQSLMNERIGAIFRQDLGFYFYRTTFAALDTLINGGEQLQRQLAGTVILSYFLPNEPIMREMDLFPWVYIVHRGKVTISQNGMKIATLTKGAIFGQLSGTKSYPIRVTATADEHVDILEISAKVFQDIIDDDAKNRIADNPQSRNDFMALKHPAVENAYNTVEYIMRGKRSLKLPWMVDAVAADSGTWYRRWLTLVWLIAPVGTAFEVLAYNTLPFEVFSDIYWFFIIGDIIHFAHFISEFYTLELIVVNNKCIYRPFLWRKFQSWGVYADLLSLLLPYLTFLTENMLYQLARLVRLRLLYDYHRHFCESFKAKITSAFIKIILIILALHALTCGWMRFACGEWPEEFPVPIVDGSKYNITEMNTQDWSSILERKAGCAVYVFTKDKDNTIIDRTFIVPKNWHYDYIVAMTYIILIQTSTNMNKIFPLTVPQIYYKIFVTFCIYIITIWLASLAISSMFLRFRELYKFDYNVLRLEKYLSNCGLSPILLKTMKDYSNCLWDRQKGNWIPELIAQQSPLCLREDILGALYMHHIDAPPLFHHLPAYFKRQLVVKLRRIVMFPGKYIIQMGDIFPCIYFIHEGEVERWQIDLSGNKKMVSLLSINGYFGLIPGLFPNTPHPYSYFTRTVNPHFHANIKNAYPSLFDLLHALTTGKIIMKFCIHISGAKNDIGYYCYRISMGTPNILVMQAEEQVVDLVYLRYKEWQDLLDGYPEVKANMYAEAKLLKKDIGLGDAV